MSNIDYALSNAQYNIASNVSTAEDESASSSGPFFFSKLGKIYAKRLAFALLLIGGLIFSAFLVDCILLMVPGISQPAALPVALAAAGLLLLISGEMLIGWFQLQSLF